jgi:hypothetical protein
MLFASVPFIQLKPQDMINYNKIGLRSIKFTSIKALNCAIKISIAIYCHRLLRQNAELHFSFILKIIVEMMQGPKFSIKYHT